MAEYGGEVPDFSGGERHGSLAIPCMDDLDEVKVALLESHEGDWRGFCAHDFRMRSKATKPRVTGADGSVP